MDQVELDRIVERLRHQKTDDAKVEVKACAQRLSNDIWSSVSAFANTEGGTIILGLSEHDGFTPVRNFALGEVSNSLVTGLGDGDPSGVRVDPCPVYRLEDTLTVDGEPVIVVHIEELDAGLKPCFIRTKGIVGGSYKRVGDQDIRLNPREIYSLENVFKRSAADCTAVPEASEANLDSALVDSLLHHAANSRMFEGTGTDRERLVRANVLNQDGSVTFAGLLVCGDYPQQFFQRLFIDVAVHQGVVKASPASDTRFLDRILCEGAVGEIIDEAYKAVLRNLHTYSVIEGAGRRDELEIPPKVIREALANAVVHREYDELFLGQSIQVDIFSDRVEITSPGGLWGGKTVETLGNGISECRNGALMKLMNNVPLPGTDDVPAEGNGTGVILMRQAMAERALEAPEFDAGFDYFKVTLKRGGAELSESRHWLRQMTGRDLSLHEESIASILHREKFADVVGVREQLGIDSDEIRQAFAKLVEEGIATFVGTDEIGLATGNGGEAGLPARQYWSESYWQERVLSLLAGGQEMTAAEIAERLGRRREITEVHLRRMAKASLLDIDQTSGKRGRRYGRHRGSTTI